MTFKRAKSILISAISIALFSSIFTSIAQPSNSKIKPTDLLSANEKADDISVPENFYTTWNNVHVAITRSSYESLPENLPINLKEGNSEFVFPVKGQLLGQFCYRGRVPHTGVDIALKRGTPVYSSFDGVVRMAKRYGGYGNLVVVRHLNGIETVYAHLSKIKVKVNQKVKAGDVVGLGGRTGRASANHLHFETRYNGAAFDPMEMMEFKTYGLISDTLVLHRQSFLPKFRILRSRRHGKSAVDIHYDENGRQIKEPILAKDAQINNTPSDSISLISSTDLTNTKKSVASVKYYVVKKGDTLARIAKKNRTTTKRISQLNGISPKKVLKPGRRIRIR